MKNCPHTKAGACSLCYEDLRTRVRRQALRNEELLQKVQELEAENERLKKVNQNLKDANVDILEQKHCNCVHEYEHKDAQLKKAVDGLKAVLNEIVTAHLDMGGKHKYLIKNHPIKTVQAVEGGKQIIEEIEGGE